ncbi:HDOD domain-containing protein [Crateriforma spongiae]|uniref:HDOD domain-containing protein n=1 Tax=Crateriforma spongiae TaxID=2724528 RepID=UPI001445C7C0|nr:HDOD domain-containing protein [Crateriforma spongiae]
MTESMGPKRQVLFVDDEPNVLSGLRRMLRCQRNVWNMHFAGGGEAALDVMRKIPIDVIVSDMRMPGMDGAELLTQVADRYPNTIRLVLSGQSEQEKIFRVIGPAHQFLSKPCDADRLIHTIERAVNLRAQLQDTALQEIISKIAALPSLPEIYRDLVHELESDHASIDRVAEMIESDLAMSAKVLQLVNSSFFGLPSRVTAPKHAASLLGLNIMRPLALSASVFLQYESLDVDGFCLDHEIQHGLAVAVAARRVAECETDDPGLIDDTFVAGMLHDIGKLILAVHHTEAFTDAIRLANARQQPLWQAELEIFQTTHAAIGGHLLGLWGLPNPVVEAVAFHHQPRSAPGGRFCPLTAVHVANNLIGLDVSCCETLAKCSESSPPLEKDMDLEYLESLQLKLRAEHWCNQMLTEAMP